MIHFERFKLDNGLTVLFHKEASTPMAVVNLLYDVGARDESEEKTGFAHLFEHLMFGGSVNIPDFDGPLQAAGGESNAFTSNDITNYYDVLPAHNLDTALWLESDRMLSLAFTDKSLEVQRNVVIEEFKQRYLNQPYGDVWLELRPLAYTKHPYKWATIGKEIKHIEDAKMTDVKAFFKKHYHPSNCILCVIGNFELDYVKERVNHFFGSIPKAKKSARILPLEPAQDRFKSKTIVRNVPADAFYYAFKMPERKNPGYYLADLLSDIMGREKVSKMYVDLIKKQKLVSEINAYITGSMDEGLFIITGKLNEGKSFADLDKEIWKIIAHYKTTLISKKELEQIKIKLRTARAFQDQGLLNRAMNLSFFELLGDANGINQEQEIYQSIQAEDLRTFANEMFAKKNGVLLKVKKKKNA